MGVWSYEPTKVWIYKGMGAKPGHTLDESMLIHISYGERKGIHRASALFDDCKHDPTLVPSGMFEFGLAALTGLIWLLARNHCWSRSRGANTLGLNRVLRSFLEGVFEFGLAALACYIAYWYSLAFSWGSIKCVSTRFPYIFYYFYFVNVDARAFCTLSKASHINNNENT